MGDHFQGFRGTAAEAVDGGDVAPPHVCQQRPDRGMRGRDRDVDAAAVLDQIDIALAVDQRQRAARAHSLGQRRCHDVVFLVVGQREEHVHVFDVLAGEQVLVGGIPLQHQRVLQIDREKAGTGLAPFDHLDFVAVLDRAGETIADVAAAGDHDPPDGIFEAT